MTPEEQIIIQEKLRQVAEILYKNTPSESLETEVERLWGHTPITPPLYLLL